MGDAPLTRPSLLVRLRDPRDGVAWGEFVDVYAPLVYGYLRRHGLQDADAADLTQDVLRAVANSVGRLDYDPRRGSFRAWLFTIVRNKLRNFRSSRQRREDGSGDTAVRQLLAEQPSRAEADEWEQEHERRLFHWAAERVRGEVREATWRAFWLTAVEGRGPGEVADKLKMSVAAVYLAKSRVMARLKDEIRRVEESVE